MLVIRVCSEEKGMGGRLRRGLGRMTLEKRRLREGCFDEITVYSKREKVRWKKVRGLFGGRPVCAVLDKELCPPAGCGIARQDSRAFCEALLLRAFGQAVRSARPVTAGFLDRSGQWADVAEGLLPVVGQLRICCFDPAAYTELIQRAVAEYGTAPLLSDDPSVLQNTAAIWLPEGALPPAGCGLIFAQDTGYGVAEEGLELPEDVRQAIPDGIPPLTFVAAAVEAGLIGVEEITCRALSKNGGMNSLVALCKQMQGGTF